MKNSKKRNRDLEQEREELLKLMDDAIPKQLKKKIDMVVSCCPPSKHAEIKFSNSGADDADAE